MSRAGYYRETAYRKARRGREVTDEVHLQQPAGRRLEASDARHRDDGAPLRGRRLRPLRRRGPAIPLGRRVGDDRVRRRDGAPRGREPGDESIHAGRGHDGLRVGRGRRSLGRTRDLWHRRRRRGPQAGVGRAVRARTSPRHRRRPRVHRCGSRALARRADDLAKVSDGARRAGRAAGSFEIEISVTVSASHDRDRARRSALRNAAQSILWYAGEDRYGRQREWSVPPGCSVPRETVEALASGWDMWKDPDLPAHLGALITDDVLDQFTVWGEPAACAARLQSLAAEAPGATGFRLKLPLPLRSRTLSEYLEDVGALAQVIAAYRATSPTAPVLAGG